MTRSRSVVVGVLFIAFFTLFTNIRGCAVALGTTTHAAAPRDAASSASPAAIAPEVQVTVSAAHTTTSWDDRDPDREKFDLPLLFLHRQREAAAPADRTLALSISGLAGGTEIQIEVVSRHANAYTSEPHTETRRFVLPDRPCTTAEPCILQWTFDPTTTLSDLYYLQVKSDAGDLLWKNPVPERPDFVILDTWDVGVGTYTVRVYYAVLFPFARDPDRLDYRVPPEAVPGFIEHQFVPMIVDTWHTQFEDWGFGAPLHPDWDADKVIEIIITYPPFAVFDGTGTYTVLADSQGQPNPERRIWWLSTHAAFQRYDSWENAHKAIFAHEFFHMAQWNVLLNTGRPTNYWLNTFIEAQAEFAVGVQYPEFELGKGHVLAGSSAYGNSANRYLALRLNASYRDLEADPISKYDLTLYWRFLYEQYGDMGVIRAALEDMARHYRPDILEAMETVMNATFARLDGPFQTFEESLTAFARANYALRLDNGRCTTEDLADCEGFYNDPDHMYAAPTLEAELEFDGTPLNYSGAIPSSYGMDFIEVHLDPTVRDQPMTVQFQGEGSSVARFNVQIWKLGPGHAQGLKPRAITLREEVEQALDGAYVYCIPEVDTTAYDRLAFIITRLDSKETADAEGNYQVTLGTAITAELP